MKALLIESNFSKNEATVLVTDDNNEYSYTFEVNERETNLIQIEHESGLILERWATEVLGACYAIEKFKAKALAHFYHERNEHFAHEEDQRRMYGDFLSAEELNYLKGYATL